MRIFFKQKQKSEFFIENIKSQNTVLQNIFFHISKILDMSNVTSQEILLSRIENITKLIGENFSFEYCSIGIIDGSYVKDVQHWFPYNLSNIQIKACKDTSTGEITGSLIGTFLTKGQDLLEWDEGRDHDIESYIKSLNNDYTINLGFFKKYKNDILNSKKVASTIILGLYKLTSSGKKPLGFIHIINRLKENKVVSQPLTQFEIDLLLHIADFLVVALNNYDYFESSRIRTQDEVFINKLSKKEKIDEIFQDTLIYLNDSFNSSLATIRIPVSEGYDSEPSKNLKLILRHCETKDKNLCEELEKKYRVKNIDTICYEEHLLSGFKDGIILIDKKNASKNNINLKHENFIGSDNDICIVPIYYVNKQEIVNPWDKILCIIYFRPSKISDFDDVKIRLKNIVHHLAIILRNKLYKIHYIQQQNLKDGLLTINFSKKSIFYNEIVNLVSNTLGVEICSLFIKDDVSLKHLDFIASNAKYVSITEKNGSKHIEDIHSFFEKRIYVIPQKGEICDSITSKVFLSKRSKIVNDVMKHPNFSPYFNELSLNTSVHRTLLAGPILDINGETLGVIRCINKKTSTDNLVNIFWNEDKELFDFIIGIISRFIVYVEKNFDRLRFLKEFTHETNTPLQHIENKFELFDLTMKNKYDKNSDVTSVFTEIHEEFSILKNIVEDLHYITLDDSGRLAINKNWTVNLNKSVNLLIEQFQRMARIQKSIKIVSFINKMPELYIDKARFFQVLINIIKNAIIYSDSNSEGIKIIYNELDNKFVEGFENRKWHEIQISNYGIGILEDEVDLIFKLYKRGSNVETKSTTGTGIGLYVANRIVSLHGGKIKITNLNNPTIFSILLPK
ncbi:MAG TPA: GAF domain-containing sensor histidine kinase [Bacteroidales bacterium]|nr:GAF domain-containing sensor histidine kinase [Bacteroidales bacterium]